MSKKFFAFAVATLCVGLTVSFILSQLNESKDAQIELSRQQIVQEAKAHFQSILDTRAWNAGFGGVYVHQVNGIEPNPYLTDNLIYSEENEPLVRVNPAWMTRQISEISNEKGDYQFKITSLKPLNPNNIPDRFEREALVYFETHKDDQFYFAFGEGYSKFDFMGSLMVDQSCMACHEEQGYQVGDVRGGIRVSIPLALHNQQSQLLNEKTAQLSTVVMGAAAIFLAFLYWVINLFFNRQLEIESANEVLESRVSERTAELKAAVAHERHLRGVLKTIVDVNELLITSYSQQTIIDSCLSRLMEHQDYKIAMVALLKDERLGIAGKADRLSPSKAKPVISDSDFLESAGRAIEQDGHFIEQIHTEFYAWPLWAITLPVHNKDDNTMNGAIQVVSVCEQGFGQEEISLLQNLVSDISLALDSTRKRSAIQAMELEKVSNYEETILAFVNIIEQRDSYTAGHTLRVAKYCKLIAQAMGVPEDQVTKLERAAILHDIGKVVTPDAVLLKPGRLNELEYDLIKEHSTAGYKMLSKIDMYRDLVDIILYHHARFDGKGYPNTMGGDKKGDEVPFLAYILSVADAFDAMTTNRIYRPRKTISVAIEEIRKNSGSQFHPEVAQAAIGVLANIDVSSTSQLPNSALEKHRFAYFFLDQLTEAYNEAYLQMIIGNLVDGDHRCLHRIELKAFSEFNHQQGWNTGNRVLREFARDLKIRFPDAMICRFHGDNFVLIFNDHHEISNKDVSAMEVLASEKIQVRVSHYDLGEGAPKWITEDLKRSHEQA